MKVVNQKIATEDHTLDGHSRVINEFHDLSTAGLFLEPIATLHNIYFERSRRVDPVDASNKLVDALAAGRITPLDLAESIVASRPDFVAQFKNLLVRRAELSEGKLSWNAGRLRSTVNECIEAIDELMEQNIGGQFQDRLYQRSFEALLTHSGVLGEAREIGWMNDHYYGSFCRKYDCLQISVSSREVSLYGFSTDPSQLERIHDLMTRLYESGIVTEKVAMSRQEFADRFQLSAGEIARRGACYAVASAMGAVGIKLTDGKELDISPNMSTPLMLDKIIRLTAELNDSDITTILQRFRDELGCDSRESMKETIAQLLPEEMSAETEQDYRWLLSELHHSLYLQYRARFHNEDRQLVSDHGSIHLSVMVDQHREDYCYLSIDRQAIAPDAYARIYREYCGMAAPEQG